jgi:Transposase DDE domain group 1
MKVQRNGREFTVDVTADGEGVVSHAGTALLAETANRIGLSDALSRGLAPMRERRGAHDPGRVVRDLAVMLASGGSHLSDLRAVRDQEPLFGAVASDATAWRTVEAIARDPELMGALRSARREAREGAWAAGAEPEGTLFIDLDPTLIEACSEKEGAAPTFKKGFGFHPMLAFLDRPVDACGGEPLAGLLRPGNAAANKVADQIEVAEEALEQLPADLATDSEIVLRFDSAGATHGLLDWAHEGGIRFSVGFDLTEPVRKAIAAVPDQRWVSALAQDGNPRENGEVCKATDLIDLSGWPQGSRLIVRRERPHPGAQLSFTDADGHRFQAILTDRVGEAAHLEREHRARARCEDRIRCAKQMGLELLPFGDFAMNAVWMELVLIAQQLVALTDILLLRGELSGLEPKRLRYRALHTAGRLAFHARRATLRLERRWPWAEELAAAFVRLRQLPAPAG